MTTIFYICGFFAAWAAGVAFMEWLEARKEILPPPDRCVERNAEFLDRQAQYIKRVERQG